MSIISYIQAQRLIFAGCLGYLSHVNDMTVEAPILKFVLIVYEFLNVFLTDFLGLPLEREVDFVMEVKLGTKPISIPSYPMAPIEIKELSSQL